MTTNKMSTKVKVLTVSVIIALGTIVAGNPVLSADNELNVLTWCDHTDPALLRPFEDKYNVRMNLKEYDGTGVGPGPARTISTRGAGMFLCWTVLMSNGW